MKEILDYQVVKADTSEGLTNLVQFEIGKSWQPVGSAKITTEINEDKITIFYFYQTMVKYEE